jgi:hypothetical protein
MCSEWCALKNRSLPAQLFAGLLLAVVAFPLTACRSVDNSIYRIPAQNYAGRPIPPSALLERVLAAYTVNGSQGGLEILDGLRDLRSNVQNTVPAYTIKGFSAGYPISIINYPEQTTGYVLSYTDGSLIAVNYSTEAAAGSVAGFGGTPPSVAAAPGGILYAGAAEFAGVLGVSSPYGQVSLNLPNVDKVVVNPSATVILAMVRNSNQLYRVVKLPATSAPIYPPGYVDCQPVLLPVYCVVPVGNTSRVGATQGTAGAAYDHPVNAVFSSDGATVDIVNCGPECGGTAASVTVLNQATLVMQNVPTQDPLCGETGHAACGTAEPNPLAALPGAVANPVPVPGGATVARSDGTNLYIAGQQLQSSGLFAGFLSTLNLTSYTVATPFSISDGNHTRLLFGDNGTLWVGASQCNNGVRAAAAAAGAIDQSANTNCLTRVVPTYQYNATTNPTPPTILPVRSSNAAYTPGNKVCDAPSVLPSGTPVCDAGNVQVVLTGGTTAGTAPTFNAALNGQTTDGTVTWINMGPTTPVQIIPMITPNYNTAGTTTPVVPVLYPNTNLNNTYYGTLYGEAWVQNLGKIYTSYGGQIHAFATNDGYEINNYLITIQGTVLDVAYMDAESNEAD